MPTDGNPSPLPCKRLTRASRWKHIQQQDSKYLVSEEICRVEVLRHSRLSTLVALLRGRYNPCSDPSPYSQMNLLEMHSVVWIGLGVFWMELIGSGDYVLWSMEVTGYYDEFGTILQ
jgi:hypothetical protein